MPASAEVLSRLRRTLQSIFGIGNVQIKDNAGVAEIRNDDDSAYADLAADTYRVQGDNATNAVTLTSPSGLGADVDFVLPGADGANGDSLVTDGAGNLSFAPGGGGGASELDDLTDVTVTTPADNQVLVYDSLAGQWVNEDVDLTINNILKMQYASFTEADDGTPISVFQPSDNTIIKSVAIRIDTPAAGTGASVSVGTNSNPDAYMEISDSDLQNNVVYEIYDYIILGMSPEEIEVTVTAGAQTFSGTVFVQYVETTANEVGGALELNELSDVTIDTPQDNEILVYDSVTEQWVNTEVSENLSIGNVTKMKGVSFDETDDGTPIAVFLPSDNAIIKSVAIRIDTPAAGTGASVSVGTNSNPDAYMEISDSDLQNNVVYEIYDYITLGTNPEQVEVAVTAGAQTFSGKVFVQYVETVANTQTAIAQTKEELYISKVIFDETLASNGDAFSTINLPAGYDDVEIIYDVKVSSGPGQVNVTINGDTNNSNYANVSSGRDGVSTVVNASSANNRIIFVPTTASDIPGQFLATIIDYTTSKKHWVRNLAVDYYDSDTLAFTYRLLYIPKVPITSIAFDDNGTSDFAAGSRIRVVVKKKLEVVTDVDGLVSISNATYNGYAVGMVLPYIGEVPYNALACDGSLYTRIEYQDLYDQLDAAGSSLIVDANNFNVPDLRDRTVFGAGAELTLDDTGGATTHTLTIAEMPFHNHAQNFSASTGGGLTRISGSTNQSGAGLVQNTQSAGGDEAHENMPPYYTVTGWCIIYALQVSEPAWSQTGGGDIELPSGDVTINDNLNVSGVLNAAQINLGISPQPYMKYRSVSFDETDDGTPIAIWTPEDDTLLKSIIIKVNTALVSGDATIEVGTALDPDAYVLSTDVDLSIQKTNEKYIYIDLGASPDEIIATVTVTSGSPTFSGEVFVQYYENANNAVAVGGVRPTTTPLIGELFYSNGAGSGYNFDRVPVTNPYDILSLSEDSLPVWNETHGGILLDSKIGISGALGIQYDLTDYEADGLTTFEWHFNNFQTANANAQFLNVAVTGASSAVSIYAANTTGTASTFTGGQRTNACAYVTGGAGVTNGLFSSVGVFRYHNAFITPGASGAYRYTSGYNVWSTGAGVLWVMRIGGYSYIPPGGAKTTTLTFSCNAGNTLSGDIKLYGYKI